MACLEHQYLPFAFAMGSLLAGLVMVTVGVKVGLSKFKVNSQGKLLDSTITCLCEEVKLIVEPVLEEFCV